MANPASITVYDLNVIGGGMDGCGIARWVGRGLSVALAEMDDLAFAPSNASTKQ